MVPYLFSPVFLRSFRELYRFYLNFSIDNPKVMPETTASYALEFLRVGVSPLWQLRTF